LNAIGVKTILMGAHNNPELFNKYNNIIIAYKPDQGMQVLRYFYIRIPRIIMAIYRSKANFIYYGIPGHMAGLLGSSIVNIAVRSLYYA
jgi:hypothetical protein